MGRSEDLSLQLSSSKFLIIHSEASLGWGGQEHRVVAELNAFRALGHPVGLVAPEKSAIFSRCLEIGIPTFHATFARGRMLREVFSLARFLRQRKPTVVNTHSSRDGWCMGIASRLARVPLLIRSRHIDVDYKTPALSRHAFTTLADHVITTSDAIAQRLQEVLGVSPSRISTLATGVDLDRFQPLGERVALPRLLPGPLIGMVSVLRSWKGHPIFFQAIRRLKDSGFLGNYVVVGGGAPEETFRKMARQHGVEDCVLFAGHREDIPEVLRSLDLLVIPSTKHEGIPQIGLQALACGTPVIGSAVGGIPEIIRANETGRIFAPACGDSLAKCLLEVFSEPEKTANFSKTGIELVRREYSLGAMTRKLQDLYLEKLEAKGFHPQSSL